MSAIGLPRPPALTFKPRNIIASHADYRPSDFMFERTQSLTMRAAPWEKRIKPMKSWGELLLAYGALLAGAVLLLALV